MPTVKSRWYRRSRSGFRRNGWQNLYTVDVSTINYHLGQIFATGELKEEAVIRKFPITAADGKDYDMLMATIRKFEIVQTEGTREVNRSQIIYNLDAIMYMQASKKMTSPVCIGKRLV